MRAWALCMVVLCWDHMMKCTIDAIGILSGWLCWENGHQTWLFMMHILLRLSVNMCMLCEVVWVLANASHIACSSWRSMFWNHGSLSTNCMLLVRLYASELATLPSPLTFGGMNAMSMYML